MSAVWVVRTPEGEAIGAGIERRYERYGVEYGDGPFAALDNARRTLNDYVHRQLRYAAEKADDVQYECEGYTLTRETLLAPEQAAVIAAAVALHRASVVERISVDDVQAKLAALFAAVEAMPDTLRAQGGE